MVKMHIVLDVLFVEDIVFVNGEVAKMLITKSYGRAIIELDSQREVEVFSMILKDANLQEIRDDIRMEAYGMMDKLTRGFNR